HRLLPVRWNCLRSKRLVSLTSPLQRLDRRIHDAGGVIAITACFDPTDHLLRTTVQAWKRRKGFATRSLFRYRNYGFIADNCDCEKSENGLASATPLTRGEVFRG